MEPEKKKLTISDDAIYEARARIFAAVISTHPYEFLKDVYGKPVEAVLKLAKDYVKEFEKEYS